MASRMESWSVQHRMTVAARLSTAWREARSPARKPPRPSAMTSTPVCSAHGSSASESSFGVVFSGERAV
jgi:hypothetical protein